MPAGRVQRRAEPSGRDNQKRRTRQALLDAASHFMSQGRKPTLDEAAEHALVSRATAYRYFPNVEALHLEASLDAEMPQEEDVMRGVSRSDAVARLYRVDSAFQQMMAANEAPLRLMLAQSLERAVRGQSCAQFPDRQNRRTPLIEAALEPARAEFRPEELRNLKRALALIIGTEGMVVFKDVLQLDDDEARKVKRWAIRALVEAARKR